MASDLPHLTMNVINPRQTQPHFRDSTPRSSPEVDIVVLNWNGWKDTIECLESLLTLDYENYRIIIVDNASTDDSVSRIVSWASSTVTAEKMAPHQHREILRLSPDDARGALIAHENNRISEVHDPVSPNNAFMVLVENETNEGYSGGNNKGIAVSRIYFKPSFIMLLNNDTVVTRDFLTPLVSFAVQNESTAILGPLVKSYSDDDTVQWTAGRMNMWIGRRHPIRIAPPEERRAAVTGLHYLSGVAILIRTSVLDRVGILDTDYFMYTEDIDFSFRIRKAGYGIALIPSSVISHKIAQSSGGVNSAFVSHQIYRNSILFMRKNARWYHWPTYITASVIMTGVRIIQMTVRDPTKIRTILEGAADGLLGR